MIRSLILTGILGLLAGTLDAAERPNLVVIQTDEHNFRTLGCYRALLPVDRAFVWGRGVEVKTPHLDWIAANGALCDRFYATSPVCTPSRAALVSGRYPQNTGAIRNDLPMLDEVVTYAEVLRRAGYATGYAGKWHLDGDGKPQWAPDRKFGFEDNRYMFNRGHYKKLVETAEGPRVGPTNARGEPNYNLDGADETTFTTDFLADRVVEFIEAHKGGPFCYHVSIPDPHGPNTVRPPYDTMFDHLPFQQPASALSPGEGLPGYAATQPDDFNPRQMALYFGMVKCIDDNVGKILVALREVGVLEKTIVVFTSDHGDLCGEHGRHDKGVPMEASARIPFLIHAPGIVQPGTVVGQALGTVDFKPTILSLMGVMNPSTDEGRDASALFRGSTGEDSWDDLAFLRIGGTGPNANGWMAAVSHQYKLVVAANDGPALFDLVNDPNELTNLFAAADHRDTVRRLGRALANYASTRDDPLLASKEVKADLEWAANGRGDYTPRPRKVPARVRRKDADDAG